MKITKVEAIPFKVPYLAPLKFGLGGYLEAAEHVLVRVHTDEGAVGVSEAMARPSIYGESQASIVFAVREWLAPMIVGVDPAHTEKIWRKFNLVAWNPTAKGALDMAVYDAQARASRTPLWEMLGGFSDSIELEWTLGIRSIAEMMREAEEMLARGMRAFRIKVGLEPKKDIEAVKSLRELAGPDMPINIDANMAYSVATAIRTIRKMEEYDIGFVEEPVPCWDWRGRLKVSKAISAPILGDESVFTPEQAAREIDLGVIGIIGIKAARTGYTQSLKIVHLAEAADMPCLMGTQAETGIGTLSAAAFGAARANVSIPSDISNFLFLKDDLLAEPILFRDGVITLPKGPGNGAVIDEEKLRKYRVD
jgi:L-alanine-DL-glutamate epimerase-like enolase superfamily enzyme